MPCVVLVKCRAKLYEVVDLGRPSVGWVAVIPPDLTSVIALMCFLGSRTLLCEELRSGFSALALTLK